MQQTSTYALRAGLGVSKGHFAQIVGCHRNTVTRWEQGLHSPSSLAMYRLKRITEAFDRSRRPKFATKISYVQADRMAHYLAKPGSPWIHWTWKQRLAFMAQRARYRKIVAEAQAGRCIIEHRTPKAKKVVTEVTSVLTEAGNRGNSGNHAKPVSKADGRKPNAGNKRNGGVGRPNP